jgi:hypothetical protein
LFYSRQDAKFAKFNSVFLGGPFGFAQDMRCAFARKIFLRDLRGENCLCFSGCGVAALGLYGKYYSQSARSHG